VSELLSAAEHCREGRALDADGFGGLHAASWARVQLQAQMAEPSVAATRISRGGFDGAAGERQDVDRTGSSSQGRCVG
jgi:hypothetical protein